MRLTILALLAASAICGAQKPVDVAANPSDAFFKKGEIPKLRIAITPEEIEKLKQNPRIFVKAALTENGKPLLPEIAIKLKGAAGSFRDLDDKPAFTIRTDKSQGEARFHGLARFHLNNSVQDGTYLQELICSDLFLAAGVPATRVTHARVWLNERDLGLYVLKEGFDPLFLRRHYAHPEGNLYDGGFCQDIDADLEKDAGSGPADHADLKQLRAACQEADALLRWKKVPELVDLKAFLTFSAMELMVGHWDGYALNRNNYRLYFEPTAKKAFFLPHGMDQTFGDPHAPVLDHPAAILATSILKNPEWRASFRKRLSDLLPLFSPPDRLLARVDAVAARLQPVLAQMSEDDARAHAGQAKNLKERIAQRARFLREQVALPDPKPLALAPGRAVFLANWRSMSQCEDAKTVEIKVGGERLFHVKTGPSRRCIAGWRKSVLLAKGRYRFSALLKTQGVALLAEEGPGNGAGPRLSGMPQSKHLEGTSAWKTLDFEFEVAEGARDVELVVELRASAGEAWFKADALKLVRLL